MKKHNDAFFLLNIVDALSDILFYTSCSEEQFLIEIMRQDAVARKFENLGESVKNLSEGFRADHPQIPWSHIARFRDILSHHYFGVDQKAVWNIARTDAKEAYQAITLLEEHVNALNEFNRKQREKVEELRQRKNEIYEIAHRHKATKLYVFGSSSRQNDLNFVAEFKDASLLDLGALTNDLEAFLDRKIAVFPLQSLKDYSFGDRIRKEMELL
jgi:uncharacterized protein with HEPN domain/predicted nucleotidyltransferase